MITCSSCILIEVTEKGEICECYNEDEGGKILVMYEQSGSYCVPFNNETYEQTLERLVHFLD